MQTSLENKSIVLFDGVCNLCNDAVNFIIKHDKRNRFLFASLQSVEAQKLIQQAKKPMKELNSIVLIQHHTFYYKSSAALHIAKKLNGLYPLLYVFIIVPPFIRNLVYDWIARNRYKWFGKKETCMIPTKELQDKFLK
jgi:predicted DCC family thiol-disulfide oxidoreductase YuxK